jgi:hypothetical protein
VSVQENAVSVDKDAHVTEVTNRAATSIKLFISWSGARSQALAQALRDWLPLVLYYVEPWLSDADLGAGERWGKALAQELETSNFGIVCITRENLTEPWILFEAGSLAKSLDGSRVIPLLFEVDFTDITGPLAQFQAKKSDKDGIAEVVRTINVFAKHPVPEAREKQLFEALWPELEKQLAAIPHGNLPSKSTRPQHEVLEEMVTGIRSLDSRIRELEERISSSRGISRRLPRRFDPFIVDELIHRLSRKSGDPIAVLVIASLFREEVPWLYEMGVDAYRLRNSSPPTGLDAFRRFYDAFRILLRSGRLVEHWDIDRDLLMLLDHDLERFIARSSQEELDLEAGQHDSSNPGTTSKES